MGELSSPYGLSALGRGVTVSRIRMRPGLSTVWGILPLTPIEGDQAKGWDVGKGYAGQALARASWFNELSHFGQRLGSLPNKRSTISKGVSACFFLFLPGLL